MRCIDELDIAVDGYEQPRPELLRCDAGRIVEEQLYSHLLKSNCPVTGQPDFAILVIDYVPDQWLVESKSLKLFLGSFRNHGAFHEDCTVGIGKRLVDAIAPLDQRGIAVKLHAVGDAAAEWARTNGLDGSGGSRLRLDLPAQFARRWPLVRSPCSLGQRSPCAVCST